MASGITHAFAATTLGLSTLPASRRWAPIVAGVVCSVLPDADVIGMRLGVAYAHPLGHRGLTHSVFFAAALAALVVGLFFRGEAWRPMRLRVFLYLWIATASHGLFDAMTNGGLGVAFLAPFDNTRTWMPWRPVAVSPLSITGFLTARAWRILGTEALFIGLPWSAACLVMALALRRRGAYDSTA